ncbi:multiple inositol polyphosphate phosphatase 1-like [Aphomia sociella]
MTAILLTIHLFIYVVHSKECYWNSCPYVLFGSKTLYDDVRGDIRDVPEIEGCKPMSLWVLARHGARNPSVYDCNNMMDVMKLKDEILNSHAAGQGEMCAQDIDNIRSWKWNDTMNKQFNNLINTGFTEVKQLGARIKKKFSHFLEHVDYYVIRPTNKQRTIESAKAFNLGLGHNLSFNITNSLKIDEVLASYETCPRHTRDVFNGPRMPMEMNRYYLTDEFKQLQRNMKKRAGLKELSINNIEGIHDLCRYYRTLFNTNKSPWCALFTTQELHLMEYSKDLQHYYRNSYGNSINPKLGGPVLKDLYQSFNNTVKSSRTSFTAYFSHDSLLDMVYSALGLFRDYPELTGFKRIVDRKWRISLSTPFAANFIAVLHRCNTQEDHTYRVQFFINEIETHLCDTRTCSWNEFDDKFKQFLNSTLDFCIIK